MTLATLAILFPGRDLGYALGAAAILLAVVLWVRPVRNRLPIPPHLATVMPRRCKQWSYELDDLVRREPNAAKALEAYHDEPYREGHPRSILGLALLDEAQEAGFATDADREVVGKPSSVAQVAALFREIAGRRWRKRRVR